MTIHKSAIVSEKATIGKNVTIGAFTIIHDNVDIGDNTVIESNCELGVETSLSGNRKLVVGKNSHIRSYSMFYEGSTFDEGLVTGHRVSVREKTVAGKNFQIGTLSDIQGDCEFGDYVRLHSNVHVGKLSKVGNYVWLFPYVVLTNDPHPPSNIMQGVVIEDYAVIATMSVILPGVTIAKGCLVGASSTVGKSTKEDMLYSGNPAKMIGPAARIRLKDGSRNPAYPWTNHFHRGYPDEVVEQWIKGE